VKFDFYLESLLHTSPEQSQMIMKCTNLIQEDNKNSDNDNQDSKKKKKKNTWLILFYFSQ
jgi:uncharacterized spore protein YtfJ